MREIQILTGFQNLSNPYYGPARGIYVWETMWVVYR